jgi:hypothetical protein
MLRKYARWTVLAIFFVCALPALGQETMLPDGKVGKDYEANHIASPSHAQIASCSLRGNVSPGLEVEVVPSRGSHGQVHRECSIYGKPTTSGRFSFSVMIYSASGKSESVPERMVVR